MPYVKVMIHYVWATKNRQPTLSREIRESLFSHIKENAKRKNIYIDRINGWLDHVHCLISLQTGQTIDKIIQMIKGESSYWFNHCSEFHPTALYWQEEYFATSVSESMLERTRNYIDNQETHHKSKTFEQEEKELSKIYGFELYKDVARFADKSNEKNIKKIQPK